MTDVHVNNAPASAASPREPERESTSTRSEHKERALGEIEARDFSFWYGESRALANINLRIQPRSVTALIGPSGCGKSTFLRSINRMNEFIPSTRHTGEVLFDGEDIYTGGGDVTELRRKIGMVFQRWNPFPKSIYENVVYGPRVHGVKNRAQLDEIAEHALHRAALWKEVRDRLRDNAFSLSGGQQQRLCIARALANDPEVLLMDEPGSALDPISTQKIEELLFHLKKEVTVIIVTHNLQQAARVSDRTAFFYLGHLVEVDDTQRLFTSPREERTEAYVTGRFG